MENTEQSLEKADDNYKVPNLEKGIAVIEYLSSRSEGETLQEIKQALVLDAIAQKEQIKADEKELQAEYELLARVYQMPASQLVQMIPAPAVATQIAQRKTMDFLKDHNMEGDKAGQ